MMKGKISWRPMKNKTESETEEDHAFLDDEVEDQGSKTI